jgi:N-(2-amino-2-carboxyethyl)-L-glutamate synthase
MTITRREVMIRGMNEGLLATIGNTPLVRLNRVFPDIRFRLFAKLEALNPGGSIKDRAAYNILKHAIDTGEINAWTVVIESSSGNMGIGLAQACAYLGLKFICVVDAKTTSQNLKILEAYGAVIDLVSEPDPVTGEYLQARIDRLQNLLHTVKNSYCPRQYSNIYNAYAHHQTMSEIIAALDCDCDYLFCATSTCGTLRGCAEYIRMRGLKTKVIAVDAIGSVIFGGQKAKRLIPGHGIALTPQLYQADLADEAIHVSDLDCITGCRRLVRREGILAGGSSGGVLMAVEKAGRTIPPAATSVAIFPDRGERYLDTIYSDHWVKEHFGDVSSLWDSPAGTRKCEAKVY